jgi:hypothetical protein
VGQDAVPNSRPIANIYVVCQALKNVTQLVDSIDNMKKLGLLFILTLTFQISFGQEKSIYGTVTSEFDGRPIKGVTVILLDSKIKVKTGDKGEYRIGVPDTGQKLLFKKKGYKTTETEFGTKAELNVSMAVPVNFRQRK